MTKKYDALIIGAGHNGLVCAFYLARAGLKVRIVERRDVVEDLLELPHEGPHLVVAEVEAGEVCRGAHAGGSHFDGHGRRARTLSQPPTPNPPQHPSPARCPTPLLSHR